MSLVKLESVSVSFNGEALFSNLNLSINSGDRIGIVGDNGSGKSSLLRSIAKHLDEYEGNITHSRGLRYQYVEQGFPDQWNESTAFEVLASCLSDPVTDSWKAEYIFELFSFPKDFRSLLVGHLSGGWKKILMIAKAVLLEPDLLLLDEPTNHLDQSHITNLIRLLRDSHVISTFAVISHNRDFLDSVTKSTLFLHDRSSSYFNASFTQARKLLIEQEQASSSARIEAISEIHRLKKSAQFQRQLGVNNYSDRALQKAKQIEKRIKGLEAVVPEKHMSRKKEITLAVEEFTGKKLIQIDDLTLHSSEGALLFSIKFLAVNRGDRLVISGTNGCGKSTLLRAILSNTESSIKLGPSVKVGVLDQEFSLLPLKLQILEFVTTYFESDQQKAINSLASSGFSYLESQKKIGQLSYGERARLAMLTLRLSNPNFLILDEPTNHLDISSQEMLEREIQRLNPAAIVVSHDVRFIENIGTRFYEISNGMFRDVTSQSNKISKAIP
ncbi:ATP-binding cassette domain-containing protein [Pseudomonas sp. H11T01]|uniref:ATP-binding cassette domain-containing protein n=1 Tax=Pseudomonas sp. H11T01 TaxID=3402749 RepID=UPI003ABEC341